MDNIYYSEIEELKRSSMRIHNITHDDMKNGPGLRVVLWVAGCEHHCPGCHNPGTWNPDGGIEFTPWEESELFEWLLKPWTEGITFSGGDPLHPRNRDEIGRLAKLIKEKYPEKNIWLYTGYEMVSKDNHFGFINKNGNYFEISWLEYVDVIIDRRFDQDIREKDLNENKKVHWKGSSNQRTIDVVRTLSLDTIICLED